MPIRVARLVVPVFLLVIAACDGTRVLSNGDEGELWVEIVVPDGVQLLRPLPAGEPTVLQISRWEQTTDGNGRGSRRIDWTTGAPPSVSFVPATVATHSDFELSATGAFLQLTLTPASAGSGALRVDSASFEDSWTLTFE